MARKTLFSANAKSKLKKYDYYIDIFISNLSNILSNVVRCTT